MKAMDTFSSNSPLDFEKEKYEIALYKLEIKKSISNKTEHKKCLKTIHHNNGKLLKVMEN